MLKNQKIRITWLKGMYLYTMLGAGGFGLATLFAPKMVQQIFGMHEQDPVIFGVAASIWTAFGLLSIFGYRSPLKFLPILCMQLVYKSVWVMAVILPLTISHQLPDYAGLWTIVMVSYIVGDLIAIPFHYLLGED